SSPRVGGERRQNRKLVRERLARRGSGAEHDVAPTEGEGGRFGLMGPRRRYVSFGEGVDDVGVSPLRPRLNASSPGREVGHVPQRMLVGVGAVDGMGEQLAAEV